MDGFQLEWSVLAASARRSEEVPPTVACRPGLWLFGGFTFDESRAVLRRPDGREVELRPKTEAVLLTLLRHAGRTVRRDALFDAVWPDTVVVDDSLTQCVTELRRALGDRAGMLRTLKRRGYVLDTRVGWRAG